MHNKYFPSLSLCLSVSLCLSLSPPLCLSLSLSYFAKVLHNCSRKTWFNLNDYLNNLMKGVYHSNKCHCHSNGILATVYPSNQCVLYLIEMVAMNINH